MATVSATRSSYKSSSHARRYEAARAKFNATARASRVKSTAARKANQFALAIFLADGRGIITDVGISRRAANQAIIDVGPVDGWKSRVLPMIGKLRNCRPFDVLHGTGRSVRVEKAQTAHSLAV